MDTKEFELGAILTVTTSRLLCDIGKLYELLNYMTGDDLFTHQLPRASEECEPHLLAQHPRLSSVNVPKEFGGKEAVLEWIAKQENVFGKSLPVQPLAPEDHAYIDPISELGMMRPDVPIIVVNPGDAK